MRQGRNNASVKHYFNQFSLIQNYVIRNYFIPVFPHLPSFAEIKLILFCSRYYCFHYNPFPFILFFIFPSLFILFEGLSWSSSMIEIYHCLVLEFYQDFVLSMPFLCIQINQCRVQQCYIDSSWICGGGTQ